MKRIKIILKCVFCVSLLQLTQSCSNDTQIEPIQETLNEAKKVPIRVFQAVEELGMSTEGIHYNNLTSVKGDIDEYLILENDIAISESELFKMLDRKREFDVLRANQKNKDFENRSPGQLPIDLYSQYSSNNLVRNMRVISIRGVSRGNNRLSNKELNGLREAVINFNSLRSHFRLTFTFGLPDDSDIHVFNDPTLPLGGGMAGFPNSNGKPHGEIRVNGISGLDDNVIEHIFTHELGHCLGLRHSDWFSRESCGRIQNEGTGTEGANHISGTPTSADPSSVMKACYGTNESGNFNQNDVRALESLYPSNQSINAWWPLYEYVTYIDSVNNFYTTNYDEIGDGHNLGYIYQRVAAYVSNQSQSDNVPFYRYYNPILKNHFYTTSFAELGMGKWGYRYEGIQAYVWTTPGNGRVPLYRYFSRGNNNHLYTQNFNLYGFGSSLYRYEGITAYVYPFQDKF